MVPALRSARRSPLGTGIQDGEKNIKSPYDLEQQRKTEIIRDLFLEYLQNNDNVGKNGRWQFSTAFHDAGATPCKMVYSLKH
ncbi:hypothetical protein JTB14_000515 [Gonioctena quinquepunctata]|nr:hypothetical protein JTB14_000515 [Gonioctena quinquepunctata]